MNDLIKALTILSKYLKEDDYHYQFPTGCDHDQFRVYVNPEVVSDEDKNELEALSFHSVDDDECFESFRFGSC